MSKFKKGDRILIGRNENRGCWKSTDVKKGTEVVVLDVDNGEGTFKINVNGVDIWTYPCSSDQLMSPQTITIFDLKEKGACEEGMEWFSATFGKSAVSGVDRQKVIEKANKHNDEYGSWVNKHFPVKQDKKKVIMYRPYFLCKDGDIEKHTVFYKTKEDDGGVFIVGKDKHRFEDIIEWEEREFLI